MTQFIGDRAPSILYSKLLLSEESMTAGKKQSDEELLFDVELLTIQQVATWAKVSTKSIYRWIEAGKIPVVKIGKRTYRIPVRAVIAQLKDLVMSL